jgi:excisionase family DNA binding protein
MSRKLITIEEAAERLGLSVEKLNSLRERGEIHAYRDGSTWKFREDELDRFATDHEDNTYGIDDDGPESVLLSEEELGRVADSTSSTVIGRSKELGSAEDSDLQLAIADDQDEPGRSDVVPAFDDLDELSLEDDSPTIAAKRPLGSMDELSLDDSISLVDDKAKADSAIDLTGDEDLVLGTTESDVTLDSGDSGISLATPSDAGLSLEEPPELGGSSVDSFELGEDQAVELDDSSDTESPTQLRADDEFLLTPLGSAEDESDSGSQVIALDEDEPFGEMAGGGSLEVDHEEHAGYAGAGALGMESGMAMVPATVEVPYSVWNVLTLFGCVMFLLLTGMFMYDLMRNMWSWDGAYAVNSSMMDEIVSWFVSK